MGQGDAAVARTEVPRYKECAFGNPGSGPHHQQSRGFRGGSEGGNGVCVKG